jgi:hypothetical protein
MQVERPSEAADLYTGLVLIDPVQETRVANSYILVRDGRIAATGVGAPPDSLQFDRTHDFSGHYAMPGFIDAHAHITGAPPEVKVVDGTVSVTMVSNDDLTQHNAKISLAFGVTTVRNPGGDPQANARYDRLIKAGTWIGPEALHAGAVIQPPPFGGGSFAYPRTEKQWQAEAKRQAQLGMRYFKLYADLSEDELATGIRVAHQHRLKAIAHLNKVSWQRAAELGSTVWSTRCQRVPNSWSRRSGKSMWRNSALTQNSCTAGSSKPTMTDLCSVPWLTCLRSERSSRT